MAPEDLDEVGDEPIYCEAYDDDVVYSGSEDDYYEAPEHRRLRIEAKAVQFLNGNVPYLLSAALQGPFDNKSWDNPWKSKRAQREARRRAPQSRRSLSEIEATKRHGSGRTSDDLPNTQRTSLYPLPSPETTNPPSPRKNALMDETEYSRIKTWREAVTSVPVTKDPFWASRQAETQDTRIASKRSADGNWLHTRGSKKRKLPETRTSLLAESPSQTAARTRRNQANRLSASKTTSAPGPVHHEDMQVPVTTPGLLQPAPTSQPSKRRLGFLESDVSEDELSMPSITSPFEISRYSVRKSLSPTKRRSLGQQIRAGSRDSASRSSGGQLDGEKLVLEQVQDSCLSTSQRSGMDMAKSLAKDAARRALAESQQDNSFYFHAKPKPFAEPTQAILPSSRPVDKTITSPLPVQICVPASTDNSTRGGDHGHLEDDNDVMMSHTESQTKLMTTDGPRSASVSTTEDGLDRRFQAGSKDGFESRCQAVSLQVNETGPELGSISARQLQLETDESHAHFGCDRSTNVCTQELSPVSMHCDPRPVETAAVSANDTPRHNLAMDGADVSSSDWSTYINTQDLTNTSERSISGTGIAEYIEISSQNNYDVTDPNWTTIVDTHDQTTIPAPEEKQSEVINEFEIVEQDPHDTSDSEWLTFAITQDQPATQSQQQNDDTEDRQRHVASIDANKQGGQRPAEEDNVESNLGSSSCVSAVPQLNSDRLDQISQGLVQAEAADPGHKFSQVNVGAIIDAYAEEDQPPDETEDSVEGSSTTKSLQNSIGSPPGRRKQDASEPEVRPSQDCYESVGTLEGPVTSVAHRHGNEGDVPQQDQAEDISSTILDETTASTEPTMSHILQTPRIDQNVMADLDGAHGTAASVQSQKPQSPWHGGENIPQSSGARMKISDILNGANPSLEGTATQSPWAKESMEPPVRAVSNNEATLDPSPASLSMLAGEAIPFSEAPQTPWVGDKLPSPNFSLSVKKFSDFMGPSPTKKRFSSSGSILRDSGMSSRILFRTSEPEKPRRHVAFAPLPGEEKAGSADANLNDENEIFVEDDVSYFDVKGNKTSSIRVVRPTARASSPPPSQVHTGDADELPDFDHKFAKHFEIMSKRCTNPAKRISRLLPSDSQPTNASQEVGAMAEAFIQASQTRKKTTELGEAEIDGNFRKDDPCVGAHFSPAAKNPIEEQENAEPVDEVSAVLDNLSDFLDNTWGFDMSMDVCTDGEAPIQQQTKTAANRFENAGDPLLAMEANVWAD